AGGGLRGQFRSERRKKGSELIHGDEKGEEEWRARCSRKKVGFDPRGVAEPVDRAGPRRRVDAGTGAHAGKGGRRPRWQGVEAIGGCGGIVLGVSTWAQFHWTVDLRRVVSMA